MQTEVSKTPSVSRRAALWQRARDWIERFEDGSIASYDGLQDRRIEALEAQVAPLAAITKRHVSSDDA